MTKTTYPDSGGVTVTYNDDGTVATRTDQRSWTVTYTYDDARRVTAEAVTGTGLVGTTAVTYAYDALGRQTSVTDNNDPNDGNDNSTVSWTYTRETDGDLKVEEKQAYGTMTDRTVTYTYDLSGRLKTMQYPSSMTLTYTYDDIGRAVKVNDGTNDRMEDTWKGQLDWPLSVARKACSRFSPLAPRPVVPCTPPLMRVRERCFPGLPRPVRARGRTRRRARHIGTCLTLRRIYCKR